ncbi:TRAP transporter substrate-binding protein [Xylanimonas cellulosilytica]|uniref:TRAP transporter substrate-binding protein n=1 Tax=Xylanimonas cellulosilytica TaxID=186189 RepID=UPI0016518720|nr:hypothetical protein [Xylanimonas cellulosilytica]
MLRLALAEGAGVPYAPAVERFAAEAHERSDGSLVVDIDWGDMPIDPEGEVLLVDEVRAGAADLAHVPARALDLAGIDRLRALQTPLLVDSLALADAAVGGEVGADMLDGLGAHGLVGLGMYVENLRRPVGYRSALVSAADFDGVAIRAQPSALSYRVLETLGARPSMGVGYLVDDTGERFAAAESTWSGDYPFPRGSTFTGNVVFFPKVNVFVAHPDRFAALTTRQQEALREAASRTERWWATERRASEEELTEAWCLRGGRLAMATASDLASLHAAVRPLVAELEADPVVGADVAAIRELGETLPAMELVPPRWCAPPTGDGARLNP